MKNRRRSLQLAVAGVALLGLLAAALLLFPRQGPKQSTTPPEEVTIAVATHLSTVFVKIADAKGFFREEGLDVTPNSTLSGKQLSGVFAGHQQRVADLAHVVALERRLAQDDAEGIRMAGMIHDIGKIAVPAEILSKPGRITEIKFDLIKTHAQAGYDILKEIEFPWPIADMVLQHHERMDGSGYPQGLKQEEISIGGLILAVADVVEAMASYRPYRPALGIDKALEEIPAKSGRLFDARVVGACLRILTEKGFKFE